MQTADASDHFLPVSLAPPLCNTALRLALHTISSPTSVVCTPPSSTASSSSSSISCSSSPVTTVVAPQTMSASTLAFAGPSLPPHSRCDDGCFRQSPPVQLELLPLHPTSHRPPLSSSIPASAWRQASVTSFASTQVPRAIDVNQVPSSVDCDDVADSPTSGVFSRLSAEQFRGSGIGLFTKREREKLSDLEPERTCEVSSRASDEEECVGPRKKLRLSKDQSALLEESFKEHSTLNPKQKNALAKQLNLRPRQVEVWFQNRRARTKLKQTEVDCELLKRCCESLTEENRRLQKELQELRAVKLAPPCVIAQDFFMPAATLTVCPSCERLGTLDNRTLGFGKPQLSHQISQPSAAC